MKYVIPMVMLTSSLSMAQIRFDGVDAPTSREQFCQVADKPDFFKSLFYFSKNLMEFDNDGGVFDIGVCWWHSMFTRNVQYLAVFRPDLPKPNREEGRKIIQWLVEGKAVVEVPGYNGLYNFSKDYKKEIRSALTAWQVADGTLGLGFIRGISGESEVAPDVLKRMMDELYDQVVNGKQVVYQKLQMKGLAAHSWLVIHMRKTETGYSMDVVDSAIDGRSIIHYRYGDTTLWTGDAKDRVVPYTSRNSAAYRAYKWAAKAYCEEGVTAKSKEEVEKLYSN